RCWMLDPAVTAPRRALRRAPDRALRSTARGLAAASTLAALAIVIAPGRATAQASSDSRRLAEMNWMEVAEIVPARTRTVLLAVGTLEAHGVTTNGADILVPDSLAGRLAERLDALIAPTLNYGVNTSIDEYPGTFGISADLLEQTAEAVFRGLADNGFRNIVVLNGHGPNYGPLNDAARRVFRDTDARILVINWWTVTADLVERIYGSQGGHAGNNETGAVLAVRPDLVLEDRYTGADQATPFVSGWSAWPFPSTIGLYAPGEGYPDFDRDKAAAYFEGVVDRLETICRDVIGKWEASGI
ncbi:MAG: creatininase family protein, partial [Gemmatimonadales bacterium]